MNCTPKCINNCAGICTSPFICDKCITGYTGTDCQTISCNISNCDSGCSISNICD